MPNIPFPNVPAYPGVPQLLRPVQAAVASVPQLAFAIGTLENILLNAFQIGQRWGVYLTNGAQLGGLQAQRAIVDAFVGQITGDFGPTLSTYSFDYVKETRVAGFAVEGGKLAQYNKVEMPGNPIITLMLSGSVTDRNLFITAIDDASKSTDLFNVVTPEITYIGYNIDSYRYARRPERGANIIAMEISLTEVRSVSAAFSVSSAVNAITNPVNPSATSPIDNGKVQSVTPDTSTLKSIANKWGIF